MVTTGGRGFNVAGSSSSSSMEISISASDTRFGLCPNSSTTSSAVSASIVCVTVAIMPSFISSLTTSPARSAIRLESSCTVMASGIVTSRLCFTFGNNCASRNLAFSFSRARRTEASDRWRFLASPSSASVIVILPRRLSCS